MSAIRHLYPRLRQGIAGLVVLMGLLCIAPLVKADQLGVWTYSTDGTNVTITGYTGAGGEVTITNMIIGQPVTIIGDIAFRDMAGLTSVKIPDSVTSIGAGAFAYCSGLSIVTIPSSVTNIGGYAFYSCSSLSAIMVDTNNPSYSSVEGILFNKNQTRLIQYPKVKSGDYVIPDGVTSIGERAFYWCSGMNSVTIPDSVTNIEPYAFDSCDHLTSVTIPSSVISIGSNAFYYCIGLTNIVISNGVTSLGSASFRDCTSLINITIPASVVNIGMSAFVSCYALTAITVDSNNTVYSSVDGVLCNKNQTLLIRCPQNKGGTSYMIPDSVTSIGSGGLSECQGMTSITIPSSVTNIGREAFAMCWSLSEVLIPNSVISIDKFAFEGCYGMTSIKILDGVTHLEDGVFYFCYGLTNVTIPNSVTSIGNSAFVSCFKLTSLSLSKNLASIGDEAFSGCGFNSIMIPSSVTIIGTNAFDYCYSLSSVYFKGNAPVCSWSVFNMDNTLTNFYYPWTSGWTDTFGGRPTQVNPAYSQWLNNYGFTTSLTEDNDHDGMKNWQEYLAGTNPTNDADKLAIISMGTTNASQISWSAKSNVSYQVMKSLDLKETWGNASSGIGTNQQAFRTADMDGLLQYADPNYAASTSAFYRVNVVP